MAKHGKNASFKLDDSGGTLTDISRKVTNVQMPQNAELLDVTAFQATAKEYITGFKDGKISFEGNADAAIATHLLGILGQEATVSFEYGPEGTASGKRKFTGEAVLIKYDETTQVSQANKFSAELQISGAVTVGTFA